MEAKNALDRITTTLDNIELIEKEHKSDEKESPSLPESIENSKQEFIDEMDDDFNTAGAMSKIFDLIKEANIILAQTEIPTADVVTLLKIRDIITEFDRFLGILSYKEVSDSTLKQDELIRILIDVRNKLREEKKWSLADYIRDELSSAGIEIKDHPKHTTWRKK